MMGEGAIDRRIIQQINHPVVLPLCGSGRQQGANWLRAAAKSGHTQALYILGNIYADGRLVPKDEVQATSFYRQAAEQGYAHAQAALAWNYYEGRGAPQDDAQAPLWYRRAADQGLANAQALL
jgi:TPR repeat protein